MAKPPVVTSVVECIEILKAMMNSPYGVKIVVETAATYKLIIYSIFWFGVASNSAKTGMLFYV